MSEHPPLRGVYTAKAGLLERSLLWPDRSVSPWTSAFWESLDWMTLLGQHQRAAYTDSIISATHPGDSGWMQFSARLPDGSWAVYLDRFKHLEGPQQGWRVGELIELPCPAAADGGGASLWETLDQERVRLSRRLHRELGSPLSAALMMTDTLSLKGTDPSKAAAPASESVARIKGLLQAAVASVRDLCTDILPPSLLPLGLGPALHSMAAAINARSGVQVELSWEGEDDIGDSVWRLAVYRTLSGLTNSAQESPCISPLQVHCRMQQSDLEATVTRRATGGSKSEWPLPASGENRFLDHLRDLKGTVSASNSKSITTVFVSIPVPHKPANT